MFPTDDPAKLHFVTTDLTDKRVLVVDRHSSARNTLRMMLSGLGMTKISGAGSAMEVLKQTQTGSFDIILSDFLLDDGRDGQQLLEELRIKKRVPLSTVFMIVTSERSFQNVVGVAELTPDDYLIKPFTADQLQTRLGKALYKKSQLITVLQNLDSGAYQDALNACNGLIENNNPFFLDASRFKGEILCTLGRYEEAESLYRNILQNRPLPWASMGLAIALKAKGNLEEAERIARGIISDHVNYLSAHDFLASVLEASGKLADAQNALSEAASISPHNTSRQRVVGDIAVRNGDMNTAERAYQTVLSRTRGSSVSTLDDYTNLSRVFLEKGAPERAQSIAQELRHERRNDPASEVAALTIDSLALSAEGDAAAASQSLKQALDAYGMLQSKDASLSERLQIDLANAAMSSGDLETAHDMLLKVVAENPEDRELHHLIEGVYTKNGRMEEGKALIETVSSEIVSISNEGQLSIEEGDLEGSVNLLSEAAERMANVRFLINASNAIFTLLDKKGWQASLAENGVKYLLKAQHKDPKNPIVVQAYDFFQGVAKKYGVSVGALRQQIIDALRAGTLR